MRYASRTDANHAEIAQVLRDLGWSVHSLHKVGGGFPDLIIAKHGINILVEIKNKAGRNRIDPVQELFIQSWKGRVEIIRNVSEAIALKL